MSYTAINTADVLNSVPEIRCLECLYCEGILFEISVLQTLLEQNVMIHTIAVSVADDAEESRLYYGM